ncbi:MAG: hypothetical protein LBU90_03460 [Bacteroidales bacterium]|jgi:hypothetical protein|nr:hypothetical protein [Bacteroidales bacterium]
MKVVFLIISLFFIMPLSAQITNVRAQSVKTETECYITITYDFCNGGNAADIKLKYSKPEFD